MEEVRYDGFWVSGRILLEGRSDTFVDRRLNEQTISLTNVRSCDSDAKLSFAQVDYYWQERKPSDLLMLKQHEYFGKTDRFMLFVEEVDPQGGPDCIRFSLHWALPAEEGEVPKNWVSTFEGKAVRTPAPGDSAPTNTPSSLPGIEGT
ncbi:hypothetical protein [Corallococcus sp. CA053C]|uniref:hypothetical protein n=1 Tax=Corallococcus sp. CA053C TaxID=2316732 RepID=UPI0011C38340|nr:hypothetical protein [Corallococcus sp. CA053C]